MNKKNAFFVLSEFGCKETYYSCIQMSCPTAHRHGLWWCPFRLLLRYLGLLEWRVFLVLRSGVERHVNLKRCCFGSLQWMLWNWFSHSWNGLPVYISLGHVIVVQAVPHQGWDGLLDGIAGRIDTGQHQDLLVTQTLWPLKRRKLGGTRKGKFLFLVWSHLWSDRLLSFWVQIDMNTLLGGGEEVKRRAGDAQINIRDVNSGLN